MELLKLTQAHCGVENNMGIECRTSNTHALPRAWPLSGCLASPLLLQEGGSQRAIPNFPSAFPVCQPWQGALGSSSWPAPHQQKASDRPPDSSPLPQPPSSCSVPSASHTVTPQGLPRPVRQVHLDDSHFSDKLKPSQSLDLLEATVCPAF